MFWQSYVDCMISLFYQFDEIFESFFQNNGTMFMKRVSFLVIKQDAVVKDTLERATEPNLNLKAYLQDAYIHPVFKSIEIERTVALDEEENSPLVSTKRNSCRGSKTASGGITPEVAFE